MLETINAHGINEATQENKFTHREQRDFENRMKSLSTSEEIRKVNELLEMLKNTQGSWKRKEIIDEIKLIIPENERSLYETRQYENCNDVKRRASLYDYILMVHLILTVELREQAITKNTGRYRISYSCMLNYLNLAGVDVDMLKTCSRMRGDNPKTIGEEFEFYKPKYDAEMECLRMYASEYISCCEDITTISLHKNDKTGKKRMRVCPGVQTMKMVDDILQGEKSDIVKSNVVQIGLQIGISILHSLANQKKIEIRKYCPEARNIGE